MEEQSFKDVNYQYSKPFFDEQRKSCLLAIDTEVCSFGAELKDDCMAILDFLDFHTIMVYRPAVIPPDLLARMARINYQTNWNFVEWFNWRKTQVFNANSN